MLTSLLPFAQALLPFFQVFPMFPVAEAPPAMIAAPTNDVDIKRETQQKQHDAHVVILKVAEAKKPLRTQAELERVVGEMQKVYENTTSFSAKYTQRFTFTLLRRTQESTGAVQFRKPGLMRWDYAAPKVKSFVVDGKSLWVHTPEDHTAMVNHCFKSDGLTASVSFLWGSGNFLKEFDVAWFPGKFGDAADFHLALTPKSSNSVYQKLILVLDHKSYRVNQSIVVDTQKNVNQFIFSDLVFNRGVSKKTFQFTAPKGTHVSPIPGTCTPPK
ncbi:MAG: outer membrane lipoprotein carrier protein LolA [Deltaproteobacteria bacterium]|nr:outer membrane lipoprotein carrier protein LolA [Deltaproteobacteria bacterium]